MCSIPALLSYCFPIQPGDLCHTCNPSMSQLLSLKSSQQPALANRVDRVLANHWRCQAGDGWLNDGWC